MLDGKMNFGVVRKRERIERLCVFASESLPRLINGALIAATCLAQTRRLFSSRAAGRMPGEGNGRGETRSGPQNRENSRRGMRVAATLLKFNESVAIDIVYVMCKSQKSPYIITNNFAAKQPIPDLVRYIMMKEEEEEEGGGGGIHNSDYKFSRTLCEFTSQNLHKIKGLAVLKFRDDRLDKRLNEDEPRTQKFGANSGNIQNDSPLGEEKKKKKKEKEREDVMRITISSDFNGHRRSIRWKVDRSKGLDAVHKGKMGATWLGVQQGDNAMARHEAGKEGGGSSHWSSAIAVLFAVNLIVQSKICNLQCQPHSTLKQGGELKELHQVRNYVSKTVSKLVALIQKSACRKVLSCT
ncbi:hypothetical protein WN51_05652 [Melipona quadrifasciata]|uniref:Uncharacterized protein n=1 Tax=Melipona quadrifasciata TaxID=166423 RepID=A0A0M8ZUE8_9HYME|nr:hypothetical protein WN51_05652 [Melipona quadrifasciata]